MISDHRLRLFIWQVLDTYQAIDEPPNSGNSTKSYANEFHLPRAELPRNAFFYSACGIIGSALSIWAVVILWSARHATPPRCMNVLQYCTRRHQQPRPSFCRGY